MTTPPTRRGPLATVPSTPAAGRWRLAIVLRAWLTARTWRELAYLVSGVFIGMPTFVLALVGVVAGVASILTVGLPLLIGVLALARRTPRYFRGPARRLLGWEWADPPPLPARTFWGRVRALLSDPAAWRALAYCLARWPLMIAGGYAGLIVVVLAPAGITYPLWWLLLPADLAAYDNDTWAGTWRIALQGAAILIACPWWLRLVVLLDSFLIRSLLHPSRSQQRIAELEAGRAALRSDAAAMLRRVERDLHDGTQARLVALGLTLSRIENRSTQQQVRALAADARGTVTEALAELRDIVRGMHPPALDDGLEVALTTLAARSAVPAEVTVSLAGRPPDSTASALYFAVAELLTNIARHAGATRVRIDLRPDDRGLRLTVTDDGHGGAAIITPSGGTGTGLAGLARRAAALDGTLSVDSPAGGPTTVTMILPERG
ncbi:histidine kinase [Actinoplanes sp. ATCC 53533]|uniref:sensor histidine kinase n=1 Tax=Actinoplanes sp. ATCC 53533 TaxID=1288362 RepID=UPI000F76FF69|nr:sensor histidine kinase [Actinoplanes sp. ATCC 53533]RSM61813.1 histidine kinase [Actinoplanes sp. ATCC 53533]